MGDRDNWPHDNDPQDQDDNAGFDWFNDDDETSDSGEKGPSSGPRTGVTGELDWLADPDAEPEEGSGPKTPRTGVTGELDWLADPDAEPEEGSGPKTPRTGVTGDLDWLRTGDADEDGEAGDPKAPPRLGVTGDLDWLRTGDADDDGEAGDPKAPPRLGFTGELEWMGGTDEGESEDEPEPPRMGVTGALSAEAMESFFEQQLNAAERAEHDEPEAEADEEADPMQWLRSAMAGDDDDDLLAWMDEDDPSARDDEQDEQDKDWGFVSDDEIAEMEAADDGSWFAEDFDAARSDDEADDDGGLRGLLGQLPAQEPDDELDEAFTWGDEPSADDELAPDWLDALNLDTLSEQEQQATPSQPDADAFDIDAALKELDDGDLSPLRDAGPDDADLQRLLESFDDEAALPPTSALARRSADEADFDALGDLDDLFDEDFLSDADEIAARQATPAPAQPEVPDWIDESTPDWLREAMTEVEDDSSAAALARQRLDRPVDDLPERLRQLRDAGLNLSAPQEQERDEQATPDGEVSADPLRDILPTAQALAPAQFETTDTRPPEAETFSKADRRRAELLSEMVESRASLEAGSLDERGLRRLRRQRRAAQRQYPLDRLVIVLLLIVAVVLPFAGGIQVGDLPGSSFAAGSEGAAIFNAIDRIEPGDYVLIAAEYGPTAAAELDASMDALARHVLMQGAIPVVVSSVPVGLLRAEIVLENIASRAGMRPNQDYFLVQFLPGGVVGLRNLVENTSAVLDTNINGGRTDLEREITGLDDFAHLIVIAERSEAMRSWMEQIAPATHRPITLATSAAARPLAEPYSSSVNNVIGLLVGYQDAYTYDEMLGAVTVYVAYDGSPVPTSTEFVPTPTPTATFTPTPTFTPTLTFTPSPTLTPSPTNTATVTPGPSEREIFFMTVTAEALATPTPTATPIPELIEVPFVRITATGSVNLRTGPSTTSPVLGVANPGVSFRLDEVSADGEWVAVVRGDGSRAWVSTSLIAIEIEGVPVDDLPEDYTPPDVPAALLPTPEAALPDKNVWPRLLHRDLSRPRQQQDAPTPETTPEIDPEVTEEAAPTATNTPTPTPTPTNTPTHTPTFTPTNTPTPTSTPTNTPTSTPTNTPTNTPTPTPTPTNTPTFTPTPTPTPTPTATPNREQRQVAALAANPDDDDDDERWYAMTLGLLAAIIIIAAGNLYALLQVVIRRGR